MSTGHALLVALLLAASAHLLPGCASSEGGVVGSGISSVQGNVVEVRAEAALMSPDGGRAAGASVEVPPVLISIDEVPDLETVTDAQGAFVLTGEFAGPLSLRFRDAEAGTTFDVVAVDVGAGATLVLNDIEIRPDLVERVQLSPPLQLNLTGTVVGVDCGAQRLFVDDDAPARNQFALQLGAASEVVDIDGQPLACNGVAVGDRVVLDEGVVSRDEGVVEVVKLRVNRGGDPPSTTIRVRRRGVVLQACEGNPVIIVEDSQLRDVVRAQLTRRTELTCEDGAAPRPCTCADVRVGDLIELVGIRQPEQLRLIETVRATVRPNPNDSFLTRATADVRAIDCAAATLEIVLRRIEDMVAPSRMLALALREDTAYVCRPRMPVACACTDIHPRQRVQIEVRVFTTETRRPEALAVTVVSVPRPEL